jgi:hypothetical protein
MALAEGENAMQIAIVSRGGSVLDAYERFFGACGVKLIHAPSLLELFRKLPDMFISGVVVEIYTMVKANDREKELIQTVAKIFPSIRTNWNPEAGFRALDNNSDKSGEESLLAFVQDCRSFKPRALRKTRRHEKKFNVLYWPIDAPPESAQRAFTLDVSTGGLFVGTCDPPGQGSLVLVVLREVDASPFKVMVQWRLPWGAAMRIPGFGGRFVDLEDERAEKLEAALLETRGEIR